MSNKDGLAKNLEVVKGQWHNYKLEVQLTIIPGIKNAKGLKRKAHKAAAFLEEWFDIMPRINSYLCIPVCVLLYIL